MANDPVNPNQIWFDIETSGVGSPTKGSHFFRSSIIQLSWAGQRGGVTDLAANLGGKGTSEISHWSHENVWKPVVRKALTDKHFQIQTEEAILKQFIKHLELNTGAELIGWNIGYGTNVIGREEALRGYDIAGLIARSSVYGLENRMQKAIHGVKLRDIGQEFAVRLIEGMFTRVDRKRMEAMVAAGDLDEDIYKQALGYKKQIDIKKYYYGRDSYAKIAESMSRSGTHVSGWSQDIARQMMVRVHGGGSSKEAVERGQRILAEKLMDQWNQDLKPGQRALTMREARSAIAGESAHQSDVDVAVARLLTKDVEELSRSDRTEQEWEDITKIWGNLAEWNKARSQVVFSNFSGAKLHDIIEGSWFQSLAADGAGDHTQEKFWGMLGEEAQAKYGDAGLPKTASGKRGAEAWTEALKELKADETLKTKYGLKEKINISDMASSMFGKAINKVADKYEITGAAKRAAGDLSETATKLFGKRGRIGMAAAAAAAMFGPIGMLGTDADDFKQQISGHWQHTLFGKGANKIPGDDHLYNTIRGLPHAGHSGYSRREGTDFGSGWIPANGNSLALSDPGFYLEGNFEAMRRAQDALADEKVENSEYSSFLRAMRFQKDSNLAIYLANEHTYAGRAMGYLGRAIQATPQEANEYFGVRVDPSVMDFRREVLHDSDKRAAFNEQLKTRQREAQQRLGRFDRSELAYVNLSLYKEMALEASNMRAVNLKNFAVEVEDADTLVLRRKGFGNKLKRAIGLDKEISVRLSGIDAPETAGHTGDPLEELGARIHQEQPYGREATAQLRRLMSEADNIELLVSSEPQTYGRYTGVLFGELGGAERDDINSWGDFGKGEQVNLNMELLRRGAVAALPFGSQRTDMISRYKAKEAEDQAANRNLGIWQYSRYKAHRRMSELLKNSITFNTFTNKNKLADNMDLAIYASYLHGSGRVKRDLTKADNDLLKQMSQSLRRHGFTGRKRPDYMKGYNKGGRTYQTFKPPPAPDYGERKFFQRKIPYPNPPLSANDDAHNRIESLRHEGEAYTSRRRTDFGSGWKGDRGLNKLHPFEASPNTESTFGAGSQYYSAISDERSANNIVRQRTAEDYSVHNADSRKGVHTSITELSHQVQGQRIKKGDLALETKRFTEYSDPTRGSKKQAISTEVDNGKNNNTIRNKELVDRSLRLQEIEAKNKRRMRFHQAHAQSVVRASYDAKDPGKRSKMGSGVTRLII